MLKPGVLSSTLKSVSVNSKPPKYHRVARKPQDLVRSPQQCRPTCSAAVAVGAIERFKTNLSEVIADLIVWQLGRRCCDYTQCDPIMICKAVAAVRDENRVYGRGSARPLTAKQHIIPVFGIIVAQVMRKEAKREGKNERAPTTIVMMSRN